MKYLFVILVLISINLLINNLILIIMLLFYIRLNRTVSPTKLLSESRSVQLTRRTINRSNSVSNRPLQDLDKFNQ